MSILEFENKLNKYRSMIDSSISNCFAGERAKPLPEIISNSSWSYAIPPPVPPKVNAGLTTTG